jgi:selenium metabolism protein YedF
MDDLSTLGDQFMDQVIVFDTDALGVGEKELGKKLLNSFLKLLCQRHEKPRTIILYQYGVRLACQGSEVIDMLRHLETDGVEILICTTCLEYYALKEKVMVGTASNMGTIQDRMMEGKTFKA